ncbi:MAG: hypothetical protein QOG56_2563, partial [Solirubrobacteraceae bacterium]|nr:hypothetical protein [Solirubrobacteraceae bacterium]
GRATAAVRSGNPTSVTLRVRSR